jgi:hypothetical protein
MKQVIKFASWLAAFFLFWCGIAVVVPQWKMFPFDLLTSLMSMLDFGIHEMGHMVFAIARIEFLTVLGGSLLQWLAPLVMMVYSALKRKLVSADLFLFWFGESLVSSAPYIGDARSQIMPLMSPFSFTGEPIKHDWAYLLGTLHLLWADKILSGLFWCAGCLVMLAAVALLVLPVKQSTGWINRVIFRGRTIL